MRAGVLTPSFARVCLLVFGAATFAPSAAAMDAEGEKSIRLYNYNFLDLEGPNATSVASYVASVMAYCTELIGHDNGARGAFLRLARPLKDPQPAVTAKFIQLGAEGQLGDSTGAVPIAPIAEVARIKGATPAEVCDRYAFFMKREADRYVATCRLSEDKAHYDCPHEEFKPDPPQ